MAPGGRSRRPPPPATCLLAKAGPSGSIGRWLRSSPQRSPQQPDAFSLPIRAIGRLEAPEHPAPEGDLDVHRYPGLAAARLRAEQQARLVRVPPRPPRRLHPARRMRMSASPVGRPGGARLRSGQQSLAPAKLNQVSAIAKDREPP